MIIVGSINVPDSAYHGVKVQTGISLFLEMLQAMAANAAAALQDTLRRGSV